MNAIPGYNGDYRTLEKLINGMNNTNNDRNMWLIPHEKEPFISIGKWNDKTSIDLGASKIIGAIRFYNYNKSEEDTLRGTRTVQI